MERDPFERARPGLVEALVDGRLDANLTQRKLAEATGVTRNTIAQIEAGARLPSAALTVALAEALDLDRDELCWLARVIPPDLREWLLADPAHLGAVRAWKDRSDQ